MAAWLQDRSSGEALSRNIITRVVQYHTLPVGVAERRDMETWFAALRSTLAANMQSEKLYPSGRVLWVTDNTNTTNTNTNTNTDTNTNPDDDDVGTTKVFEVEAVEKVFQEIMFATNMLSAHMPLAYDRVLEQL